MRYSIRGYRWWPVAFISACTVGIIAYYATTFSVRNEHVVPSTSWKAVEAHLASQLEVALGENAQLGAALEKVSLEKAALEAQLQQHKPLSIPSQEPTIKFAREPDQDAEAAEMGEPEAPTENEMLETPAADPISLRGNTEESQTTETRVFGELCFK